MKKYYACFYYSGKPYVIRFKIKGSLKYDKQSHCFMDRELYVRTVDDVVCLAACNSNPHNVKAFAFSYLITQKEYQEERMTGTPKWEAKNKVILWTR